MGFITFHQFANLTAVKMCLSVFQFTISAIHLAFAGLWPSSAGTWLLFDLLPERRAPLSTEGILALGAFYLLSTLTTFV